MNNLAEAEASVGDYKMYGQTNVGELVKALQSMERIPDPGMPEGLAKATFEQGGSATSGLTYYDLEPGAKFLYPVLTPLRNSIARVSGKGGIQANWRAITAINTENLELGVSQGNRGGVMAKSTKDYNAAYKGLGLESSVTFEGQYAGQNFIDVRATAGRTLLEAVMLGEEKVIFAGNGSLSLGVPGTPTLVGATTGGSLVADDYDVRVVALSHQGLSVASVAGGIKTLISRTNADGSVDEYGGGSSNKSAAAAVTTTGTTSKITATVAPVRGAFGYAWFWGPTGGDVLLGAITTVPTLEITAAAAGTQNVTAVTADNSRNTLVYDGLITQALAADSGAYYKDLLGEVLTADGAGGIVEIDEALKWFWDNWRLSPDTMWVSAQEALSISQKILAGGAGASNFRINVDMQQGFMAGGVMVRQYLNRFSMGGATVIDIKIHPNAAPGMIFFFSATLPYPVSNVSNTIQILERQSYYQIEWPLRSRKYEYGVYYDGVLQHYAPFSMGVISGIGAG